MFTREGWFVCFARRRIMGVGWRGWIDDVDGDGLFCLFVICKVVK